MANFLRKLNKLPAKVLISRTDRIGDFILTLPVFEVVKKYIPVEFTVLCQETVAPLLENNPFVDQIISISSQETKEEVAARIKKENFDALLVIVNDATINELMPLIKEIPIRIGPLSKPSTIFRYTHPVRQKRSQSLMNEAEYNMELLKIFGLDEIPQVKPQLYIAQEEQTKLKEKLANQISSEEIEKAVIIHAGMGGSALNWPNNYYQDLIKKLLNEGVTLILGGGSPAEIKMNQEFENLVGLEQQKQVFNLTAQLTVREYAVLMSMVSVFIGPSTGPTHMANAAGAKVVSFYPPIPVQSITRWQPFLANSEVFAPDVNCPVKYKCKGKKCPEYYCMDQIKPEQALKAVLRLLGE